MGVVGMLAIVAWFRVMLSARPAWAWRQLKDIAPGVGMPAMEAWFLLKHPLRYARFIRSF